MLKRLENIKNVLKRKQISLKFFSENGHATATV